MKRKLADCSSIARLVKEKQAGIHYASSEILIRYPFVEVVEDSAVPPTAVRFMKHFTFSRIVIITSKNTKFLYSCVNFQTVI